MNQTLATTRQDSGVIYSVGQNGSYLDLCVCR